MSVMLKFRSAPDYETKTTYMVTVKADDGTYEDTHDVTIMVTNVDEDGNGDAVGGCSPRLGVEIMATLTDPDMVVDMPTVMWQWARSSDAMDGTYGPTLRTTPRRPCLYMPVAGDENMLPPVPRRCTRTDTAPTRARWRNRHSR